MTLNTFGLRSGCGLRRIALCVLLTSALVSAVLPPIARGEVVGTISGIVTDPKGAVVVHASVEAVESSTNLRHATETDGAGFYSLGGLAVGEYNVSIRAAGFKEYRRTKVTLNAGGAVLVSAPLTLGERTEVVNVSTNTVHVESVDTQLGEVIENFEATSVPLNGRSFTDLLALQPGVAPATTFTAGSLTAAGASVISPSGDLNPGNISINGQREFANGFSVNGANVEEPFTMGAGVIPNLDSIAEFRILSSNVDAEYGNYSGGQISVVTKSGTNQYHGSGFEFFRNTALDARNYFSPDRATFEQNQYGGTLGGPALKNRLFFFGDYQGTRQTQGVDSGLIEVPSNDARNGNLTSLAGDLDGTVGGPYFASLLSQKLGYSVTQGEAYYTPSCTSTAQCVFPGAVIPKKAWSTPATNLLKYIPVANVGDQEFSTSAQNQKLRDNKGAIHVDYASRAGTIAGYYALDDYAVDNPYPTQQGGSNVPGFNALTNGRSQLISVSDTKTFGARSVNQAQFSYLRDVNVLGSPVGTVGTSLVSQGFVTASGGASILPQRPAIQAVENVIFNNFIVGATITGLNQYDNIYRSADTFSRVFGTHTLKVGGELMFSGVNANADVQSNGTFSFFGSETGSDFADFLLGAPSRFTQGDAQPFYMRNRYGAMFLEDSWRARSNLTINYGIRYDIDMPWYEKFNQIQTLIPGEQSVVYPGAPRGLVFPGDPGVSRGLGSTRWNNLSPRIGVAYSPSPKSGLLGKLLGASGQTSVRASFGRFFSAVEGISAGVMAGDPPYGSTYTSPDSPLFSNPYISAASGFDNGQRFPIHFPPLNASASHPNTSVDWAPFLPVNGLPGYAPNNVSPYAEQYNLSLQRQLGGSTVLTLNYIGSQAHHLLVLLEANPGDPALCLSVSQLSQVAPGTATCGPFGETGSYTKANGQTIDGTRPVFGSNFGSVDYLKTIGNSNYNAAEITLRHVTPRSTVLAGYTYGKSLDYASSIADELNPYNLRQTYALSSYDIRHNFVASYTYRLPIDQMLRRANRLTEGWVVSGITRFNTGFPVTMSNSSDNSLYGTQPNGVNPFGFDLPQVTAGPLQINHNPRNGNNYFNTSLFSLQPLGQPGNASHRYFYGPGLANYDMAAQKYVKVTERTMLEIRMEAFNVFNHAQFFGPTSVDGDVNSDSFGQVTAAAAPRLMQAAVRFAF